MSNSYFGTNLNLGDLDYGKFTDFSNQNLNNLYIPFNVGNTAGQNNTNNKNWFQRTVLNPSWWAPPAGSGQSANPSVNSGLLEESPQSIWLGTLMNSGGVLTDKEGETTDLGKKKEKDGKNDDTKGPSLEEEHEYWVKKADHLEGIGKRGAMAQWQKEMWGKTIPKLIAEGGYKAGEIGGNTGANLIAASQSIRPANVMTQFTYQPRTSVDFARLLGGL
tara:strand:+ start:754 stop:1410 length:657 start_codon:yes stop_codon:yes gene_type:complete